MVERSVMEGVMARWESSGMSLRSFGIQEEISYAKLMYWKRKLRGAGDGRKKRERAPRTATADLVAIDVIADESPTASASAPFSVWLGKGLGIDVPAGFDDADLRRLVTLLGSC